MSDVYAWHDPFAEISAATYRAETAERDLNVVSNGFGSRLISVWNAMARHIVMEVAKPYAREHGDQAVAHISDQIEVSFIRDIVQPEMMTFQAFTIAPIRVMFQINDDRSWR